MEAWHFLREGGYTGTGNLLVVEGQTLRMPPPVQLCSRGFHFSVCALDGLQYAPGPVVQRVWVPDDSILGADKGVAPERKCLWMYDATEVLHEFACMCAESALMIAGIEDERSWNAIHVKREWLAGRASDGDLDAARDAAWAALRDVAGSAAAWAAARSAAWATARDAAWSMAWSVAWSVSWSVAWAVVRDAERSMAWSVARDEAWSAAWRLARDEAWDEMNAVLEWMLFKNR